MSSATGTGLERVRFSSAGPSPSSRLLGRRPCAIWRSSATAVPISATDVSIRPSTSTDPSRRCRCARRSDMPRETSRCWAPSCRSSSSRRRSSYPARTNRLRLASTSRSAARSSARSRPISTSTAASSTTSVEKPPACRVARHKDADTLTTQLGRHCRRRRGNGRAPAVDVGVEPRKGVPDAQLRVPRGPAQDVLEVLGGRPARRRHPDAARPPQPPPWHGRDTGGSRPRPRAASGRRPATPPPPPSTAPPRAWTLATQRDRQRLTQRRRHRGARAGQS